MAWKEFIDVLLSDFRLSGNELASLTGLSQPSINKIMRGQTDKPYPSTVKRIETALKIKIDDRDPENISYTKIPDFGDVIMPNRYPVLSDIKAGITMEVLREHTGQFISLPYEKTENCFVLRVIGDSMNGTVQDGDHVLVDMNADLFNGCVVAVRLRDGRKMIKRYKELTNSVIMFYSDNPQHEPITVEKSEIEAIYRVVLKTTKM